jgi:GT2 family glycosyltransferase
MTHQPEVAIILVNWNGWQDSIACIETCLALTGPSFRIILCDNGSTDGSVETIAGWARGERQVERDPANPVTVTNPRLPQGVAILDRAAAEAGADGDGAELLIVRTGGNLGFAGGNNVGLRWALARDCAYAWLLNNDTVVPPDALAALIEHTAAGPKIGMCGSLLIEYYEPDLIQGFAGAIDRRNFQGRHLGRGVPVSEGGNLDTLIAGANPKPSEALYPIGASILVTNDFLKTVGLMEESYFLYYEEADWVLRATPRFTTAIATASHVYHRLGASAGSTSEGSSAGSMAFLYRSRLRIARRFAPARTPLVALKIIDEALRGLARGRTSKAIAASRALTGRVAIPK